MQKQLYEKQSNQYNPIFPIVRLEDIIDTIADKSLQWIFNNYNHIYVNWRNTIAGTRNEVPAVLRRNGLWITYNTGKEIITEYYIGDNTEVNNTNYWTSNSNWRNYKDIITDGSITYQHLSEALKQALGEDKNITNFPDEEDLTTDGAVLSFKDRKYKPHNFSGLGRVILRKNIIKDGNNFKNILTQDMINQSNTIYEIRYDFDLNKEEIIIPKGCVLDFQGGSLNNGNIKGNFIIDDCGSVSIPLFNNIQLESLNKYYYLSWFVAKNEDASFILNNICSKLDKCIYIDKTIKINNTIKCASGTKIQGIATMRNFITIPNTFNGDCVFKCFSDKNTAIASISISDIEVNFEGTIDDYCPIFLDIEYLLRGSSFNSLCLKNWNNTAIRTGYHNYSDVSEAINFNQIVISMMANVNRTTPILQLNKLHESIFNNCRCFNSSNFGDKNTYADGYNDSYIVDMLNCNDITFTNCFFGAQKGIIINVTTTKNHISSGIRFINNTFEQIYKSEQGDVGVNIKAYDNNGAVIDSFCWYGNRYNYPTEQLYISLTNVLYSIIVSPRFYVLDTGGNSNLILLSKNTKDNSTTNEVFECPDGRHKYFMISKDKTFDIFRHANYTRLTSKSLSGTTEYTAGIQLGGDNIYDNKIKLILNDIEVATFNKSGLVPNVNPVGSSLPTENLTKGKMYFDENTKKPIWWTGSKWVDATGQAV